MTPALARVPMHLSALLACFMVCAPTIADDIAQVSQRILSHPNGELQCAELDGAMASLDAAGQADLLRRLVRDGDPPMAAHAFVMLVQRDAVDDATRDVLDLEIRDWVPGLQLSAISAIGSIPDSEQRHRFAEVVRAATEVALERNAAQADREHITLVDWSLIALSRMDDPHSNADAKAAIQRMPASSGAWIVLLQRNAIGDEERAIAQGILDDEARPVPLRVLAAIALGGSHPTARDYVASVVNGTVDQFGESTLREIMIASMGAPGDDPDRLEYVEFLRSAEPVMSSMSLVRDGSLDATLRRCAGAQNEMIRDMARYAIASASPHLVLEDPPCITDPALLLETAAAAAIVHPDMRGALDQRFGAAELTAAIETVVAPDGGLLLGWSGPPVPCEP